RGGRRAARAPSGDGGCAGRPRARPPGRGRGDRGGRRRDDSVNASRRARAAPPASMTRGPRVALPTKVDVPKVTGPMLARALAQARTAVSAPVVLTVGPTRYRLPRGRIAGLLGW